MAAKVVFFLLIIPLLMKFTTSTREYPGFESPAMGCWTALYKIKSCSNEIIAYFVNREIDITPPCCQAITVITHNCWPAVLSILRYDPDQANVLRGYCDAVAFNAVGYRPVMSPAAQPFPAV